MRSYRGAAITALVLMSIVAGSQALLKNQYTTYTPGKCNFSADGRGVDLILNDQNNSYASMESKQSWQYGGFGAYIKLCGGNSAGTVTTLYLSSSGPKHCEFDFEFLGNETGQPYILHTNIFVDGIGGREVQIFLWFDPTLDYHYYNVQWNKDLVVFYVDSTPIRMYRNLQGIVPNFAYPTACPMQLYISMWDGSQWATEGGRIKMKWSLAPFVAHYRSFKTNGCLANPGDANAIAVCQSSYYGAPGPRQQNMGGSRTKQLRAVKAKYLKYNYCDDRARYPTPFPECAYNVL